MMANDTELQVLSEIRDLLTDINEKLDAIRGEGIYGSLSDIGDKLDEIQGYGVCNSLADIGDKLDEINPSF